LRDLPLPPLLPAGVDRKDASLQEILFPLERLDRRLRPPFFRGKVFDAPLKLLYALVDRLGPEKVLDGHPRDTRVSPFDLRGKGIRQKIGGQAGKDDCAFRLVHLRHACDLSHAGVEHHPVDA
jgi:hypothetical protein